ncbi:glycosyltransferase family 4 protein [Clostridium algidicarnis]|uniref:glycosyltransferase family 4 protein n=1 Tax=Clostridium algidicarnis TaxID=37659 RepID=UPI001C0BD64E|nr:glycosyltransferase family 4 protein [Clostridium algidicarnis]MBU3207626.1 glycosyltransferase family 4 protein [Clostridium algidicarnis]
MKRNILIIGPYLPGKSFGGPVKSLYNMVETLGDNYNFYIITGDRDLNSNKQYESVKIGKWNQIGKANVLYVPNEENRKYLRHSISKIKFDIIYCSSFFAKMSILVQLLKFTKEINIPVIIAPRGEFSSGALEFKVFKKRVFLMLYKLFKINKLVYYTCTTKNDEKDIKSVLGQNIDIIIAGNIVNTNKSDNKLIKKEKGCLEIVTISRVAHIKNIDYSLNLLKEISNSNIYLKKINFDIYGPIEDELYYKECLKIIHNVADSRIKVRFMGIRDYDEIVDVLSQYHLFLFPSKGENFGHVIQEALLGGCPVIISDLTPWRNLEKLGVGFDISLSKPQVFIKKIVKFLGMDDKEYISYSNNAFKYGISKVKNQSAIIENKSMFEVVLNKMI